MKRYLVTGATGVVGSAIVSVLLERPDDHVTVLVRARDDAEAQVRLRDLLAFLELDPKAVGPQVTACKGDVEIPRLGLAPATYDHLCHSTTHVIHSAASVRMNLPLDQARRAAVTATENVLRLARESRTAGALSKIEMVSTVGVGGIWNGPLPERWIHEPRRFHNTYEQAKAEAELLIEHATNEGLPITVHRPSMVVGDSRSGRIRHFQVFYHLVEFLSARRTFGFLPQLEHRHVDVIPVDFLAKAIVWSSTTLATGGRILHLCAGPQDAVRLNALKARVRARMSMRRIPLPRERIVPAVWLGAVARLTAPLLPARFSRPLATLPVFLDYLTEDQSFSNEETSALLSGVVPLAPPPEGFRDVVLDHYLDQKQLSNN